MLQRFPGNPLMKRVLQENKKNKKYEGKKHGLSEKHNIFVAADEEKRITFMKKQINNSKRKKNENLKKTGQKICMLVQPTRMKQMPI